MSLRVRSFTGPSRAALNISRKGGERGRKWQWEKKGRMREGGRSSARWLYGMSRLCLARVRNVIHTPLAFRHVPFRSRLRLLLQARYVPLRGLYQPAPLTKLGRPSFHLRASRRRVASRLRPVKYRARRKCRSASTFWDSDFHYPALQKPTARGRALMSIDLRVMARDP